MIIEICATSIESILNAKNAGAHRLELCENYNIGGVTPSEQFLFNAIKVSSLPINILIRPKGGDFIFNNQESDKTITFVIGGSFGLSSEIKDNSNKVLSASLFTFPHRLFRLILVEQIYRAHTIVNNMPYHK